MFVIWAFVCATSLTCLDLIFIKIFQLENYNIKKYIKNIVKCNFSIGNKNKLKFTNRANRLIFCNFIFNFLIFIIIFNFFVVFWQIFCILLFYFLVSPLVEILPFLVVFPIEELIKKSFIAKAKKKLARCQCKKIGITGSFGKTSTKNMLYDILLQEFDVCATPKSFNTPMGVCKTILENLKETDDFFIVEMGARHIGDIEYLSKFVGVNFGIITPIGNCHLETFGCIENIEKTKYELCENSEMCVFNGKSKSTRKLFKKYWSKKFLVCDQNGFSYAKNIKNNENGSTFTLVLDGNEIKCKTKVLGKTNIDNIVVAASMAYILGESLMCIQKGIEKIKPVAHRLELIKGYVNVVDDSYNSNFEGFEEALSVLKTFPGRKIVVSPGMVELGKEQYKQNYEIAKKVAKVCDFFVIMNETNKKALKSGAIDAGLEREKIFHAKNRLEQKNILKKLIKAGDCVLFENDFPDNIK